MAFPVVPLLEHSLPGITLIDIFSLKFYWTSLIIDHFTVACLVTWPLNESEAGDDLTLIETSWLFLC